MSTLSSLGSAKPFQSSGKISPATASQLSPEAQELLKAIQTLTELLSKQIEQGADKFTPLAKSAETKAAEAAKAVEKEIAAGERNWFGTPKIFQTNSTPLRNRLVWPVSPALRDLTLVAAPMSPFMRSMPMLAAIPATVGIYRFVRQKLANNELRFWMKEIGPKSTSGDLKYHEFKQRAEDRATKLQASREIGADSRRASRSHV